MSNFQSLEAVGRGSGTQHLNKLTSFFWQQTNETKTYP